MPEAISFADGVLLDHTAKRFHIFIVRKHIGPVSTGIIENFPKVLNRMPMKLVDLDSRVCHSPSRIMESNSNYGVFKPVTVYVCPLWRIFVGEQLCKSKPDTLVATSNAGLEESIVHLIP